MTARNRDPARVWRLKRVYHQPNHGGCIEAEKLHYESVGFGTDATLCGTDDLAGPTERVPMSDRTPVDCKACIAIVAAILGWEEK